MQGLIGGNQVPVEESGRHIFILPPSGNDHRLILGREDQGHRQARVVKGRYRHAGRKSGRVDDKGIGTCCEADEAVGGEQRNEAVTALVWGLRNILNDTVNRGQKRLCHKSSIGDCFLYYMAADRKE